MTSVSLVKQRLAAAVDAAAITWTTGGKTMKLTCYSYMPNDPELPCFVAGEVQIKVHNTMRGADVLIVTCTVFVSASEDLDAQQLLDQLISNEGTASVRNALLAARGLPGQAALSGAADDLAIDEVNGYGLIQVGGNDAYYGANIIVRVIGS